MDGWMDWWMDGMAIASRSIILSRQRTTKALIRLPGCGGWSAPLLFAYGININSCVFIKGSLFCVWLCRRMAADDPKKATTILMTLKKISWRGSDFSSILNEPSRAVKDHEVCYEDRMPNRNKARWSHWILDIMHANRKTHKRDDHNTMLDSTA